MFEERVNYLDLVDNSTFFDLLIDLWKRELNITRKRWLVIHLFGENISFLYNGFPTSIQLCFTFSNYNKNVTYDFRKNMTREKFHNSSSTLFWKTGGILNFRCTFLFELWFSSRSFLIQNFPYISE